MSSIKTTLTTVMSLRPAPRSTPITIVDDDVYSDASSVTMGNTPRNSPPRITRNSRRNSVFSIDSPHGSSTNPHEIIDNDPDKFYSIHSTTAHGLEIMDLTGNDLMDNLQAFAEGDYLTDEAFDKLSDTLGFYDSSDNSNRTSPSSSDDLMIVDHYEVEEICEDGIIYRVGHTLELRDKTYLRITSILLGANGTVAFSGRRMGKAKNHVGTYIPKWENELIWITDSTELVPFEMVKQFVKVNFTNYCPIGEDSQKMIRPNELFCRLKETTTTSRNGTGRRYESTDTSVEYLCFTEADEGFKFNSPVLRRQWRGTTQPFGEKVTRTEIVDLTDRTNAPNFESIYQYTFGDAFCGAGGVSCGARQAGLWNQWAVDFSPYAIETYRLNFEATDAWQADINNFLSLANDELRVDVMHGSPPCQTFSPAHTHEGRDDDANSACIFVSSNLINKLKPRIYTMEETSGLSERHQDTFYRVIQDFIEIGYSVRWSVLNCVDYGVPQCRRRLIVVASGPGERLPQFPKPTHGLARGLKPFATINHVISRIPRNAPDHDVQGAESRGMAREPFDPNQQARTITTGGGDNNYHPSGLRGFTNREFACLQTFPLSYKFGSRQVRKQIGNAVPPVLAEALYREIIRSLECTDTEELADPEVVRPSVENWFS